MRSFAIIIFIGTAFAFEPTEDSEDTDTIIKGNLYVTFNATSAVSSDEHPQMAAVDDLWCFAWSTNRSKIVHIEDAYFVRFGHIKNVSATFPQGKIKAHLPFGVTPITSAGIYRCVINTVEGVCRYGFLYLYARPVFHWNISVAFESINDELFYAKLCPLYGTVGGNVSIKCPVIGFPKPNVDWLKDNQTLTRSWRILISDTELRIKNLERSDKGVYSCIATNKFPDSALGENRKWVSRLDQELRFKVPDNVTSKWATETGSACELLDEVNNDKSASPRTKHLFRVLVSRYNTLEDRCEKQLAEANKTAHCQLT